MWKLVARLRYLSKAGSKDFAKKTFEPSLRSSDPEITDQAMQNFKTGENPNLTDQDSSFQKFSPNSRNSKRHLAIRTVPTSIILIG